MSHSLYQYFHIALSSWTFDRQKLIGYFLSWQRALEDIVDIDKSKISKSDVEEMTARSADNSFIENETLVVHLQQITLEICEICILKCLFGQICKEKSFSFHFNWWDWYNWQRRGNGRQGSTIIFLNYLSYSVVFISGSASLCNGCVIVIGSDVRHIVYFGKSVSSSSQSEVGTSMGHV